MGFDHLTSQNKLNKTIEAKNDIYFQTRMKIISSTN